MIITKEMKNLIDEKLNIAYYTVAQIITLLSGCLLFTDGLFNIISIAVNKTIILENPESFKITFSNRVGPTSFLDVIYYVVLVVYGYFTTLGFVQKRVYYCEWFSPVNLLVGILVMMLTFKIDITDITEEKNLMFFIATMQIAINTWLTKTHIFEIFDDNDRMYKIKGRFLRKHRRERAAFKPEKVTFIINLPDESMIPLARAHAMDYWKLLTGQSNADDNNKRPVISIYSTADSGYVKTRTEIVTEYDKA